MPTPINFGLEFAMTLLVSILLVKWYVWPYLREEEFSGALLLLLSPFLVRYLGLMSLVPGVVESSVTRSSFALYQAYGDFVAFVLAFTAFVLVRFRRPGALGVVWAANVFGTIEFLNSVIRGGMSGTGGSIGAFWYIPVAYVPLGLVAHGCIFVLLVTRSGEYTTAVRGRAILSEGR